MDAAALHLQPPDARRGAIVVVGAPADAADTPGFCADLAQEGFEVATAAAARLAEALSALAPPVFVLALQAGGVAAWAAACEGRVAAASLFDPPLEALAWSEPAAPTALHLTTPRTSWPDRLQALEEDGERLRLYPYAADPGFATGTTDAARLARLRTLQLFHRASGLRSEMGG